MHFGAALLSRGSTDGDELSIIDLMKPVSFSGLAAVAALNSFVSSARADFASCVGSIKAEAARAGISARTLGVAFDGLQPDPKVLDFQGQQPEFKTPIWDYMAGLADAQRVADGKQMAEPMGFGAFRRSVAMASTRRWWSRSGALRSNYGEKMGTRPLVQSLATLSCMGGRARYFPRAN